MKELISVIMPVHNGEDYLTTAIDSVLNQSYSELELIVVNDGSTDQTSDILKSYTDPRLKILDVEKSGLVEALNHGLNLAKGSYIARMDADDICEPDRLEKQASWLKNNADIGIVCSDINKINSRGEIIGKETYSGLNSEILREALLYKRRIKPVIHPSIMMRREVYEKVGGYRNYHNAEDHDLWLRCLDYFGFSRLPIPLLKYRVNQQGVSHLNTSQQLLSAALSAVNYKVSCMTGVDIYVDRADLLNLAKENLSNSIIPSAAKSIQYFRRVKYDISNRSFINAAKSILSGLINCGAGIHPYINQKRLGAEVDRVSLKIANKIK